MPSAVEIDGQRERYCTLPRCERLLHERQNETDDSKEGKKGGLRAVVYVESRSQSNEHQKESEGQMPHMDLLRTMHCYGR